MKQIFTCLLFVASCVTQNVIAQFRIVGYLNTWDDFPNNAKNIHYKKITHLNIAFANPDADGNLTTFSGLSTVVNNAHAAGVKVLMSMGGADLGGTKKNWKNLTQPENVQAFCNKLLQYVQDNNLDGLDVDLEGNIIGKNYGGFIQTLSSVLKPKGKLVTAAVATWFANNIPASSFTYFDFVNIMSYDATGPWDPDHPGPHSPYSMAVDDLNFWRDKGLPSSKMGLGVPFYGWGFYNKFSEDEYAYKDIVKQYPGAEHVDQIADTIYYNGLPTMRKKTRLAIRKGSGIMIWQLTEDAKGNKSLLNAIYNIVHNNTLENKKPIVVKAVQ
jgi:GH18 family chitinase